MTQYKNGNSIYKYEYNDMGQKIKTIEPDGDILTYTYNTSNQLMSIKKIKESGNVYKSVFTYNDAGKLVQQEEGSGTIYIFSYDDNGNLIKKYDKSVNKNVRIYSYNSLNQRIKVQDSKGIKRINYREPLKTQDK